MNVLFFNMYATYTHEMLRLELKQSPLIFLLSLGAKWLREKMLSFTGSEMTAKLKHLECIPPPSPTAPFNSIKPTPVSNETYVDPLSLGVYMDRNQIVLTHRYQPHKYANFLIKIWEIFIKMSKRAHNLKESEDRFHGSVLLPWFPPKLMGSVVDREPDSIHDLWKSIHQ